MSPPDPRGMDPVHILGVCGQAAGDWRDQPYRYFEMASGVRVDMPSHRAARDVLAALTQVGYHAFPLDDIRRGRSLLVAEWSTAGLESRLAAMRSVLSHLAAGPGGTAAAAIEQARRLPATSPADRMLAHAHVLTETGARLRGWVRDRSGIHAPHLASIMPADVEIALKVSTAWNLETVIDDLIEAHLRVAARALLSYSALRPRSGDDQAQETALRWASRSSHPSRTAAQDSPAPPGLTSRPRAISGGTPVPDPTIGRSAHPAGRHFPAGRPGQARDAALDAGEQPVLFDLPAPETARAQPEALAGRRVRTPGR